MLLIGLDPELLDFSAPAFAAFPGLTAAKVTAGTAAQIERLKALGYDAHLLAFRGSLRRESYNYFSAVDEMVAISEKCSL